LDNFESAKKSFLEGLSFLENENFEEAELKFLESLRLLPERVSTLTNLAATQIKLKKYSEAKTYSEKAVELDANNSEAFLNLGFIEKEVGNLESALTFFNKALTLDLTNALAFLNKGAAFHELKRYEEALGSYKKAIELKPDYHEAWSNQGVTLNELKRYEEALGSYKKAIELKLDYHEAWSNQGVTLNELKRYEEALGSYKKAIELKPDYHEAWSNQGVTLNELKRHEEAIGSYERAIQLKPDYAIALWNLALNQLLMGDFKNGWDNFESRWYKKNSESYRHKDIPALKDLKNIATKTILVWSEQGYGDTIQFCRFITNLASLGASIILEVQPPLKSLMETSFSFCQVVSEGGKLINADFQVPLLSLPLLFGTTIDTIPNQIPYLKNLKSKSIYWGEKLEGNKKKLNIGVAFSGNENHQNDHNRSMNLALLRPLLRMGNLCLIQKNIKPIDRIFLNSNREISFLGDSIHSFADSGAIVEKMDIIVSVDTSLAHLSGALGIPTYVLLPWNPDWRWLLDRKDSPWYPTVKTLRQPSSGDWESVVIELISEINNAVNESI